MTTDRLDDYVEAVLSLVGRIPRGRVTTYGALADALLEQYGGGPRQVARVMALSPYVHEPAADAEPLPWWRCVRADGTLPDRLLGEARQAWLEEGTPLRPSGAVDVRAAYWPPVSATNR